MGVGRGEDFFLQTRVPREDCWGPDGVTRGWGWVGEVRGLGKELDLLVQIRMYSVVGETSGESGEGRISA